MGEKDLEILRQYIKRGSLQSIECASLGKTLMPSQVAAVVYSLLSKRVMVSFDTGLGKTEIAIAILNLCLAKDRAIFIVKRNTLEEILGKLCESLRQDLSIGYLTNQNKVIEFMINQGNINTCNVILISSDSLLNDSVSRYIYSIRNSLKCVVIDEMHLFSNLQSIESRFMEKILQATEYAIQLTATPFERDPQQVLNSIWMLDHNAFGGLSASTFCNKFKAYDGGLFVGYRNLEIMKKYISKYIFNITREILNIVIKYDVSERPVKVTPEQKLLSGNDAIKSIKATKGNAYYKLVQLLHEYKSRGLKGLVYINLNGTKEFIYKSLSEAGFRVGIVDGAISGKYRINREEERDRFRANEIDFLITNIVVSSDLECDFIIYYELTQSYKQMTGRGIRTFKEKNLIVDLIYGEGSYEETFLHRNVYERVTMLAELCDKDMAGLNNIKRG